MMDRTGKETDGALLRPCLTPIVLSLLLLSCGGPGPQEQKLPPSAEVKVNAASRLVTLKVKNVPLKTVLAELGEQAQITVSIPDDLQTENLSLSFQNVPLEEALKRVLVGHAFSFVYRQDQGQDVITGVRLFAKQEPPALEEIRTAMAQVLAALPVSAAVQVSEPSDRPLPATKHAPVDVLSDDVSLDELKRSFSEAQDPALRSAMLEALADRGEEGPVTPILANALSDSDEGVRETALNLLKSSYDPVPIGPLASMAALDTNPDFRSEALTLMTDQLLIEDRTKEDWAAVTAALNRGLSDPDPDVRDQAAMLLPELSQATQPYSKTRFGR